MFEGYGDTQEDGDFTFTPELPAFEATGDQPSDYQLSRSTL